MKLSVKEIFASLFLLQNRFYRYFLLAKMLKHRMPELEQKSTAIKKVVVSNVKRKPLQTLTFAVVAGLILSKFIKK